jgi:homoserine O-acetyltransferase
MNQVKKERFFLPSFKMECGQEIPVEIGYETYGKLNPPKDNVVLVCHFFSSTSHAAGRYTPEDPEPGWWDSLIGPGKAIDTNRFFVISSDTLCNIQLKNPMVYTTGPATINPLTGKPYGMTFPQVTYGDMAGIQKKLIESLGIERLYAVIGPSAGGMQALNWAIQFPDLVERCISVICGARIPVFTSLAYLKAAIDAIQLDPNWNGGDYYGKEEPVQGLSIALQLMNLAAYQYSWYEENFPRKQKEQGTPSFQIKFDEAVLQRMQPYDANHYIYTSWAAMSHNIGHNYDSLEEALSQIQARLLMISCSSDLLFPPEYSKEAVDIMKKRGGNADYFEFESPFGHMGGVLETFRFAKQISSFLNA